MSTEGLDEDIAVWYIQILAFSNMHIWFAWFADSLTYNKQIRKPLLIAQTLTFAYYYRLQLTMTANYH